MVIVNSRRTLMMFRPEQKWNHHYETVASLVAFALFILSFRYLNFYTRESKWKMAIENWVVIAFISWILMQTGGVNSPLLNLHLLVIIASAITRLKQVIEL